MWTKGVLSVNTGFLGLGIKLPKRRSECYMENKKTTESEIATHNRLCIANHSTKDWSLQLILCSQPKLDILSLFVVDKKPGVLCINEQWLVEGEVVFIIR